MTVGGLPWCAADAFSRATLVPAELHGGLGTFLAGGKLKIGDFTRALLRGVLWQSAGASQHDDWCGDHVVGLV